jgi:DNA-binding HxlR family transcriptional regulator
MESDVTQTIPKTYAECQRVAVPMIEILSRIAGKWTIYVILALQDGPKRFSDLKRKIEGISQKMLTSTLRDLEQDGLITRTVTPTIPPRVDYELTEMGRELREPLAVISQWAFRNGDRVSEARERYAIAVLGGSHARVVAPAPFSGARSLA